MRRTIIPVAASVIIGLAFVATASTNALAAKKVAHVRAAPVPAVVVDYVGPPADRVPKCFNSAVLYPSPPCY
jgi:hypothetical protein